MSRILCSKQRKRQSRPENNKMERCFLWPRTSRPKDSGGHSRNGTRSSRNSGKCLFLSRCCMACKNYSFQMLPCFALCNDSNSIMALLAAPLVVVWWPLWRDWPRCDSGIDQGSQHVNAQFPKDDEERNQLEEKSHIANRHEKKPEANASQNEPGDHEKRPMRPNSEFGLPCSRIKAKGESGSEVSFG